MTNPKFIIYLQKKFFQGSFQLIITQNAVAIIATALFFCRFSTYSATFTSLQYRYVVVNVLTAFDLVKLEPANTLGVGFDCNAIFRLCAFPA